MRKTNRQRVLSLCEGAQFLILIAPLVQIGVVLAGLAITLLTAFPLVIALGAALVIDQLSGAMVGMWLGSHRPALLAVPCVYWLVVLLLEAAGYLLDSRPDRVEYRLSQLALQIEEHSWSNSDHKAHSRSEQLRDILVTMLNITLALEGETAALLLILHR